ncbi:hypothetical protein HMPREF0083_05966 [Aneurinibacillus aneurinilyticus ATCC 12856]|uniref:Uncharacterized protein n=1 Tax=Aneurinibacillus aneurinilyticus ATCC 12856 TaxID=649747 RepID=U1Y181_ANEAE|nr:hypothetical protein HMPREF0083_05966 [Aneurinibacillus aneurinilyticus ATCC 12856]
MGSKLKTRQLCRFFQLTCFSFAGRIAGTFFTKKYLVTLRLKQYARILPSFTGLMTG